MSASIFKERIHSPKKIARLYDRLQKHIIGERDKRHNFRETSRWPSYFSLIN